MALHGKRILAVVPARGGSKSIPHKNLAVVGGKSLIAHAADTLAACDWIDGALLSTDDEAIRAEGVRHGLAAPFLRPAELSSDTASSIGVWQHAWRAADAHWGEPFDISLLIEPTSPLRLPADLLRTAEAVARDGHPAAATLCRTPAHFTPHKTLTLDESGAIGYYLGSEGRRFHTRQAIPSYYHRNGVCYALTRRHLLEEGKLLEEAHGVIIDRPLANIDDPFELELAEWLLARQARLEPSS